MRRYRGLARGVAAADLMVSVLVPSEAHGTAERVADALRRTGETLVYVDANAVAPATAHAMADVIDRAGSSFVDAGIIGPPPSSPGSTRLYASGPDAAVFGALAEKGLDIRVIGPEVGRASALKMVYAAQTKGYSLMCVELLVAARRLGVYDDLMAEWEISQQPRLAQLERGLPALGPKAYRWEGEMREISQTFRSVGFPGDFHEAAAVLSAWVAGTPPGAETPEERTARSLRELIDELAAQTAPED